MMEFLIQRPPDITYQPLQTFKTQEEEDDAEISNIVMNEFQEMRRERANTRRETEAEEADEEEEEKRDFKGRKKEKINKIDMIEAISEHLEQRGQRLTNLKKAPLSTLNKLIYQYNINIEEFKEERKQRLKEAHKRRQEQEKLYQESTKRAEEKYKQEEELYKKIKETLKEDEKEEIKENYINQAIKEDEEYFNNNKDKIKEAETRRRKLGKDLIERLGGGELSDCETYIKVNGLNVMIDSIGTFKKKSKEHLDTLYERNEKILYLEAYEANEYDLKNKLSIKYIFMNEGIKNRGVLV